MCNCTTICHTEHVINSVLYLAAQVTSSSSVLSSNTVWRQGQHRWPHPKAHSQNLQLKRISTCENISPAVHIKQVEGQTDHNIHTPAATISVNVGSVSRLSDLGLEVGWVPEPIMPIEAHQCIISISYRYILHKLLHSFRLLCTCIIINTCYL